MKKIAFVSTTRADFDLLAPVIKLCHEDPEIEASLYISGTHLDPEHGYTSKYVEDCGFAIKAKINILTPGTTPKDLAQIMANALTGFAKELEQNKPDLLVVLGDRYEMLSIVAAAALLNIPIAHLYGGEKTLGAIDESVRHSITKFSHLHFTSCEEYRKRAIQLGEDPEIVFNVGSIGVENIKKAHRLEKSQIETELGMSLPPQFVIGTLHPESLRDAAYQVQMVENFLGALSRKPDLYVIFTHNNADTYADLIQNQINEFVNKNPNRSCLFKSLGQQKYYSLLKFSLGVIGNSSSGIIEVPSFKLGTLNIGDRQKGRISAKTVIHSGIDADEIHSGLIHLMSPEFRQECLYYSNPYEKLHTAQCIFLELKKADLSRIKHKVFYDLQFQ